jgi:ketosteroid isomerase-like protein
METTTTANLDLEQLFRAHQSHNDAFFNGTAELPYWVHDDAVTLHGGFDISERGWEKIQKGLTWASGRMRDGQMTFTPLGGRIVGDMAYVAGTEEGTVVLDGERRPMKLRVTNILQRVDGEWLCIHRHGEIVREKPPVR